MKAIIITIGDEILIGQILDTNSQYISKELTLLGIEVINILSIADSSDVIREAVDKSMKQADLVVITGGLGPTKDDKTKKVLADYFDSKLVLDEKVFKQIKNMCHARGVEPNELNKQQAFLPDKCTILPNEKGTAAGMWFEKNNKYLISLPGVPFEMVHLMETQVIPKMRSITANLLFDYRLITVYGVSESALAIFLTNWETELEQYNKNIGQDDESFMHLAYLPSTTMIKLRITAKGNAVNYLDSELNKLEVLLKNYRNKDNKDKELPERFLFTIGKSDNIEELLANTLRTTNKTICTAESCTGGYISHLITSIPGSSEYFKGSIIAYSNEVKHNLLNVPLDLLDKYGAVSEPVVKTMAENVKSVLHTDYSIATSGIAGPSGGSENKPVGTVWIAVSTPKGTYTTKCNYSTTRERVIGRSSVKALQFLIEHI